MVVVVVVAVRAVVVVGGGEGGEFEREPLKEVTVLCCAEGDVATRGANGFVDAALVTGAETAVKLMNAG